MKKITALATLLTCIAANALATFCGNDPVNKVDPLGLSEATESQNYIPYSVVQDLVTGQSTVLGDAAFDLGYGMPPTHILTESGPLTMARVASVEAAVVGIGGLSIATGASAPAWGPVAVGSVEGVSLDASLLTYFRVTQPAVRYVARATVGRAILAIETGRRGKDVQVLAQETATVPTKTASLWRNSFPGVQTRQFGDWWVKRINPNANAFLRWWGRQSINAQSDKLSKLGDMATPSAMRNDQLFTRDVGQTFTGGRFSMEMFNPTVFNTYVRASTRIGPVNDIIPRNMGVNGVVFDPAVDWFTKTLIGAVGGGIAWSAYEAEKSVEGNRP